MPKVGQTEQPVSKDLLLVELDSLRKQNDMSRVPVSSAVQMLVARCYVRPSSRPQYGSCLSVRPSVCVS